VQCYCGAIIRLETIIRLTSSSGLNGWSRLQARHEVLQMTTDARQQNRQIINYMQHTTLISKIFTKVWFDFQWKNWVSAFDFMVQAVFIYVTIICIDFGSLGEFGVMHTSMWHCLFCCEMKRFVECIWSDSIVQTFYIVVHVWHLGNFNKIWLSSSLPWICYCAAKFCYSTLTTKGSSFFGKWSHPCRPTVFQCSVIKKSIHSLWKFDRMI